MIHDGYLFDFPGRGFEFQLADLDRWFVAGSFALDTIAREVEPGVAEAIDGEHTIRHLVSGDSVGGAYTRDPARTTVVSRIDAARLVAWFAEITNRGTVAVEDVSIADGWYRVDAQVGDVIRLHQGHDATDVLVRDHGGAAVLAPDGRIIVPPIAFKLDANSGTLRLAVHWSPWVDRDGCGRARFDRIGEALTSTGWTLTQRPAPADLEWKRWTAAPVTPLLVRERVAETGHDLSWIELPATTVVLGLTAAERDQLADVLVIRDRQAVEADGTLGYRDYDERKRRDEIVAGLSAALGRAEIDVARCAIMNEAVTNEMWSRYMAVTGAARPASWTSATPSKQDPVTGISCDEAAGFAAHHGWTLPTEAEWQLAAAGGDRRWFPWGSSADGGPRVHSPLGVELSLDGASEYTLDRFAPYPNADPAAFERAAPGWRDLQCLRGSAPKVPACIPARRGLARDHRFKFARFRCVRRT